MADTTDGRRRRGFALALLVALTALLLAPAVAFAPPASAATGVCAGGTSWPGWTYDATSVAYGVATELPMVTAPADTTGQWLVLWRLTEGAATDPCTSTGRWMQRDYLGQTIDNDYGDRARDRLWRMGKRNDGGAVTLPAWPAGYGPPPDTTAPDPPTGLAGTLAGPDLQVTFTASVSSDVTGYRYRVDAGAWQTWAAPIPCAPTAAPVGDCATFTLANGTAGHTVELQAYDAAGNYSTSATLSWTGCTVDTLGGCVPVENTSEYSNDTPPDCADGGSTSWHCLWWGQGLPNRPVHTASFVVQDYGMNRTHTIYPVVGWACAPTGYVEGTLSRSEGVAPFRGGEQRTFLADCGTDWVHSFYVLGGTAEDSGHDWTEPDPADWQHLTLWWSYGAPAAGEDPAAQEPGYYAPAPAPTTGPTPAPTTVYDPLPLEDPTPAPSGGCDFGITDPSSWLCSLAGVFGRLLNAVSAILGFLRDLGAFLTRLLVPSGAALQSSFSSLDTAWDTSAPGVVVSGIGDVAAPLTNIDTTPPATCQGVQVTLPLGQWSMSMNPLSTCSELTQYILGILIPLESALIYLGGFFLAARIVSKPFGLQADPAAQT